MRRLIASLAALWLAASPVLAANHSNPSPNEGQPRLPAGAARQPPKLPPSAGQPAPGNVPAVAQLLRDIAGLEPRSPEMAAKVEQLAAVLETEKPALSPEQRTELARLQERLTSAALDDKMRRIAAALDPASYLKKEAGQSVGITRFESLLGKPVEIIDVSDYAPESTASSAPDLNIFSIGNVFAEKKAYLGFGRPNVYLALPKKGHVFKFDAKSLKRAPSQVVPTMGKAQSGLLLVLKDLSQEALAQLLETAKRHEGSRHWTCVNANCRVLSEVGFTVGGESLNRFYFPMPLLRAILNKGLELNGQPVAYDLVRVTPKSLEKYGLAVNKAVRMTAWRHLNRSLLEAAKKSRLPAALIAAKNRLAGLFSAKKEYAEKQLAQTPIRFPAEVKELRRYNVRVSHPSKLGTRLRLLWGSHMLFRLEQDKVDVNGYLAETLKAFPQANPSLLTRLKSTVLFSRPVVALIRSQLAGTSQKFESRSDREIFDMFRTHSADHDNKYNIVVEKDGISVMKLDVGLKTVDWILSKHVLISGYSKDVRFAGEIWKGEDGRIYVSNNSGTYMPTSEQLDKAAAYLQAVFPNVPFVAAPAK